MESEPSKRFLIRNVLTLHPGKFLVSLLIFLGACSTAFSAGVEWTLTPTAQLRQNYTDNFNLTDEEDENVERSGPLEVWSTEISGGLNSKFQSDQWFVATDLRYLHEQFWGDNKGRSNTSLNRDDAEVALGSTYTSEYWKFDLNGSYKRDQPRSSEINRETGEAFQSEAVFDRITRLTGTINPGLTWFMTEQTNLGISYQFIDVAYNDVENLDRRGLVPQNVNFLNTTGQTNFFRHQGDLTLTHQLAEPTSIFAQAGYIRIVNDKQITESDQYRLSAGIDHSFSDTFTTAVTAGGIWLKSETPKLIDDTALDGMGRRVGVDSMGTRVFEVSPGVFQDDMGIPASGDVSDLRIPFRSADQTASKRELGYLVSLQLSKKFEYSQLTGLYSHNFIPTSTGGILEEDRVALNFLHNWTEYFSSTVNLFGSITDTIGGGNTAFENGRKSAVGRVELAWRFTEHLFLAGGYRYRWQNQDSRPGRDSSNDVFVSLRYDWDPYFVMP